MSNKNAHGRPLEFDKQYVRDFSVHVYRQRLGEGEANAMIAKDGDAGEKLRDRARPYDDLTRNYLRAFGELGFDRGPDA
jgi:hypothetical protein